MLLVVPLLMVLLGGRLGYAQNSASVQAASVDLAAVAEEEATRVVATRMPEAKVDERRPLFSPEGAAIAREVVFKSASAGRFVTVVTSSQADAPPLLMMYDGPPISQRVLPRALKAIKAVPVLHGEPEYRRAIFMGDFTILLEFAVGSDVVLFDPVRNLVLKDLRKGTLEGHAERAAATARREEKVKRTSEQWNAAVERFRQKHQMVK